MKIRFRTWSTLKIYLGQFRLVRNSFGPIEGQGISSSPKSIEGPLCLLHNTFSWHQGWHGSSLFQHMYTQRGTYGLFMNREYKAFKTVYE